CASRRGTSARSSAIRTRTRWGSRRDPASRSPGSARFTASASRSPTTRESRTRRNSERTRSRAFRARRRKACSTRRRASWRMRGLFRGSLRASLRDSRFSRPSWPCSPWERWQRSARERGGSASELGEGAHRPFGALTPRVAGAQPDIVTEFVPRTEEHARRHGDAFREGGPLKLERIDVLGQLDPEHEATARVTDARAGREAQGDRRSKALDLVGESRAKDAQVALVAPAGEELRERSLQLDGRVHVRAALELHDPIVIAPARYPTDAVAGGEGLGDRRAVEHAAVRIERLHRPRAGSPVVEVAVEIVFDERHVVA